MTKRRIVPMGLLTAAGALALLTGCSESAARLDRRDRADRLVIKAKEKEKEGDLPGAIRLYTLALDRNPELALAHLDLAILYHDRLKDKDYVRAIYHYRRYLDLRPSTEKTAMIGDRIRLAGQLFSASITKPDTYAADRAAMEKENSDLRTQVHSLTQEVARLQQVCAQYQASQGSQRSGGARSATQRADSGAIPPVFPGVRPDGPRNAGQPLPPPRRTDGGTQDRALAAASAAQSNAASRTTLQTYRVKNGDTLSRIAAQVYQDPTQWPRIRDANRRVLGDSTTLKAGQLLVIP